MHITLYVLAFLVAVSLLVIAWSLLIRQPHDSPPTGCVKFLNTVALFFLCLAGLWEVFWAIKWAIAPSHTYGSMSEDMAFLIVGTLPLTALGVLFGVVSIVCACVARQR